MSRMSDGKKEVVVTDIEMPFASMVVFMVKWAIASIPAMILLGAVASLFWLLVYGLFGGGYAERRLASVPVRSRTRKL
jgi:hypothetical protein